MSFIVCFIPPSRLAAGKANLSGVISGKNLKVPSERIPAGIYISLDVDPRRRWKSTIRVLSADESVAWNEVVTVTLGASPKLSLVMWASFEINPILGNGEVIGKLEMSWDELLDRGNEPFALSFPRVRGVHPSLMLKATVLHAGDNQDNLLFDVSHASLYLCCCCL